jgi:hypothetical protein
LLFLILPSYHTVSAGCIPDNNVVPTRFTCTLKIKSKYKKGTMFKALSALVYILFFQRALVYILDLGRYPL